MNKLKDNEEPLLALKVMRLTRPSLGTPIVISSDSQDLPVDLLSAELKQDPTADPDIPTIHSGQMLLIPQSFGNIYLGETFFSYMFTHNVKNEVARMVTVKADLQTAKDKIVIAASDPNKYKELAPGATIDMVIAHEVKEEGLHILVCEVSYLGPHSDSNRLSFKKIYKFNVLKPLDIKSNIYKDESDVLVEVQIQNLISGCINLEKVVFKPASYYESMCISDSEQDSKLGAGILQSHASRQFLYCLKPVQPGGVSPNGVGIVDVTWRSNMGERGRLQTSQLEKMSSANVDLRLSVTRIPTEVKLEEPFTFTCEITNLSKQIMNLTLVLERVQNDLAWVGKSGRRIDPLHPGASTKIDFTMVPLVKGLRPISGVRLRELENNLSYDYDELAQVFVT